MARDLAGFETRVLNVLMDATKAVWATDQIDEGLRHALDEYSRAGLERGAVVKPNSKIATVTPTANWREVSLSTLTGLLNVSRVWFPYYSEAAYYSERPAWIDFDVWWSAGAATLFLDIAGVPDGTQKARIFYNVIHTLEDLDSAASTSFDAQDDSLLVLGAAGWACFMRSLDVAETADVFAVATPNYAAIATRFLKQFRAALIPRMVAHSGKRQHGSSPSSLGRS